MINDKQIINGIDVSECPLYDKKTGCYHTFDGECVKDSCVVYKWLLEYKRLQEENKRLNQELDIKEKMLDKFMIGSGETLEKLQEENEGLKETINRLQKDCKRNNDLYMKEWDKNYKLSEISKEYNARRCIEKLYRLICDDTKSVQETYITLKDEVSEFLRIHKTMSSKYEEARQTYKQALEKIREIAKYSIMHNSNLNSNYQIILQNINEVLNDRDWRKR